MMLMWVEILGYSILGIYLFCIIFITFYCLSQVHLLIKYWTAKPPIVESNPEIEEWPFVTIQLPLYNEKYVVARLIDNIMMIDYPKDMFEVHILDDSTDETLGISKLKTLEYKDKGFNIECLTRVNRVGFKAGALKEGMLKAKGDFIAIFDADFLPHADFLKKTLGAFHDKKVGVVQTRWGHINQDYSLLTELQSFQLNVHFTIEQFGRYTADYPLQFNGTAGVWRRDCIEDAGGWEADTLTEDLDLSYRAQMKGWKIAYLKDIVSPAELPADIFALKSQQFRWMKGGAENAKKLLPSIWKSNFNGHQKLQATVHLLASSVFLLVFSLGVISVPLMFFIVPLKLNTGLFSIFYISTLSIILVYFAANVGEAWPREPWWKMAIKFVLILPIFLALSMGLALHNSLAVLQGFFGQKSPFIRTPKYGLEKKNDTLGGKSYFLRKWDKVTIGEGFLSLYFMAAVLWSLSYGPTDFMPFHILLSLGYLSIFIYAMKTHVAQ